VRDLRARMVDENLGVNPERFAWEQEPRVRANRQFNELILDAISQLRGQEQIEADHNIGAWQIRPLIERLRELAKSLDIRTLEFRQDTARMEALADAARSRAIGAGRDRVFRPNTEEFLDQVAAQGVSINADDRLIHRRYLLEVAARNLAQLLDQADAAREHLEYYNSLNTAAIAAGGEKKYDTTALEELIASLPAKIAEASPVVRSRANAIREEIAAIPAARAARRALAHPSIVKWSDTLDRMAGHALTPRGLGEMSRQLASSAQAALDRFNRDFLDF